MGRYRQPRTGQNILIKLFSHSIKLEFSVFHCAPPYLFAKQVGSFWSNSVRKAPQKSMWAMAATTAVAIVVTDVAPSELSNWVTFWKPSIFALSSSPGM